MQKNTKLFSSFDADVYLLHEHVPISLLWKFGSKLVEHLDVTMTQPSYLVGSCLSRRAKPNTLI